MPYRRPRGTQDLLPAQAAPWRVVEEVLRHRLDTYGYGEIRTPLFEETDLFVRSVGADTDIVQKEMYTFRDRKDRSLTLRPEGTAPVVRAFLENNLGREAGLQRLYYLGPMYRYDRPQAGRFREFFQVGAEAIGSPLPELDVEIVDLMMAMLRDLGLKELDVEINSVGHPECRASYERVLHEALAKIQSDLCRTCVARVPQNPLRVFDCKNPGCRELVKQLPLLSEHLCDACQEHFDSVCLGLESIGVSYRQNPRLVRGLDYYTRTAFEVHYAPLGAQSALGGGGRYDGLVEACGGPATPAVGFSSGIERILVAVQAMSSAPAGRTTPRVWVVPLGTAARRRALGLARELRQVAATQVDLSDRSLKAQLRSADRASAQVAVILGDEELARGEVIVRDLRAGEQTTHAWDEATGIVGSILDGSRETREGKANS